MWSISFVNSHPSPTPVAFEKTTFVYICLLFGDFFFRFFLPWHPNKFSHFEQIHMNRRGLLKKHFCWKILYITVEGQFIHYNSMEIVRSHSNHSSYTIWMKQNKAKKNKKKNNYSFPPPIMLYVKYGNNWLQSFRREVSWKYWRRTDDKCLPILVL